MSAYSKILCVSTLFSILASSASVSAAAAPITNSSSSPSAHRPRSARTFALPDDDGWLHFDSIGMMLPVSDGVSSDSADGGEFGKRTLPVSGSRDLVKRSALLGRGEDGDLVYQLQEESPDGTSIARYDSENDDDYEEEEEEDGDDEDWYAADGETALDKLDSRSLSSASGLRSLARRAARSLSSLMRRKSSKKSSNRKSQAKKSGKKSAKKGKKQQQKKASNKNSNKATDALELGKGLIMKGATLL